MNYDTIILELLSRVQAPEEKVKLLEGEKGIEVMERVTTADIKLILTHCRHRRAHVAKKAWYW